MNAAADCHTNTTAENMKSLYMLSCCTDTTLLDGKHHATASRGRGGLLHDDYDDGSHEQKNGASSKMPPMKQASSSSSSSRGGDYWTKGGTNNTTPSRSTTPMTTPNQRKIYSANDHHNDHLINNLPHSNRDNNNTKSSSNAKPFASNPLIYRGDDENDSLWEGQSLFSLLASDTDCEENGAGAGATTTTPHTNNGEAYAYYTPHRNNRQQQQQNRSMSYNALSQLNAMPPPSSSSTTAEEDSPMIELSLAKQVANMAQMTNGNLRKTNREMLRNYRTINHGGLSSSSNRTNSMMDSPGSPTKRIREHNNKTIGGHGLRGEGCESGGIGSNSVDVHSHHHHHKKLAAMAMPGSERSSSSAMETDDDNNNTIRPYYMEYINAPPPPVWSKVNATTTTTTTINTSDIDSELVFTYSFPRLYLQDPTHITEGIVHGKYNCDQMKELWWFHAAQHMETTLRHVQEDHWRALLSTTATTAVAQPSSGKHTTTTTTNSKMESSNSTHSFVTPTDGCASMKELCLGKQQQHPQRSDSETFSPSNTPTNVWSEPCASTMFVRGRTYSKDGVKVESETSIFTMLGVDSFVNGDKSEIIDPSSGTNSYLRRWKRICNDMGLHRPPFLLIINFIVPWGNFQAYLVRPDADEGPFSSCKQNHPSEKAWRKFMEGSTEYRNKRFKLIPRIVAGPWMVKKMVGSTPALIGTKLPMSYRGSISENYLEISLDVTKGPAFGNSVANTVVGKADAVTVDLGFVIEGNEEEGHLPEQVLGLFRLHHLNMKKTPTQSQWNKER